MARARPALTTAVLSAAAVLGYLTYRITVGPGDDAAEQQTAQSINFGEDLAAEDEGHEHHAEGPAFAERLPEFSLDTLAGTQQSISSWPGKPLLINFWATWCAPCRDEMPSIQRLTQRLAGRPFVALAVNLDEPETRIRKFLSETSLHLTVLLDPGRQAAKAWNARILPASFVVGPEGAIRYSVIGEIDWNDERVARRISELLPAVR